MNLVLSASSGDRRGNTQSNRSAGEIVEFIRRFWFTGSVIVLLLTGVTNPVAAQSQQPRVVTVSQAILDVVQRNLNMFAHRYNVSLADAELVTARMGRGGDSAGRIECTWAECGA
jgi:hypothetical protein